MSADAADDDGAAGTSATVFECSVCSHPQVREINAALEGGTSVRDVAGTFSLSRSAVGRHRLRHLSLEGVGADLAEAGIGSRFEPVEVHGRLSALAEQLDGLLKVNLRRPERATSLSNIARELRATLEAIARLQADEKLQQAASADHLRSAAAQEAGQRFASAFEAAVLGRCALVFGQPFADAVAAQFRQMLASLAESPAGIVPDAPEWIAWREGHEAEEREDRERQRVEFEERVAAEVELRLAAGRPRLVLTAGRR